MEAAFPSSFLGSHHVFLERYSTAEGEKLLNLSSFSSPDRLDPGEQLVEAIKDVDLFLSTPLCDILFLCWSTNFSCGGGSSAQC